MIPVGGLDVGSTYGRWGVGWIVGLLKWVRDDEVKPCVSISSSNEIMRFFIVRFSIGARSTDLSPESFLLASIGTRSTNWSPESFLFGMM